MKRLVDLSIADLEQEPVWLFIGTTDEGALVEPTALRVLSESLAAVHIARTNFQLADGSRHLGFCSPQDASGLDYLQPVLVAPTGHVRFWFDRAPTRRELDAQWKLLGRTVDHILPLAFNCEVLVDGLQVAGEITMVDMQFQARTAFDAPGAA